jgi:hypothetical protein
MSKMPLYIPKFVPKDTKAEIKTDKKEGVEE